MSKELMNKYYTFEYGPAGEIIHNTKEFYG